MIEFDPRQAVAAHQSGDERAFAEIVRFAHPMLYSTARRRLHDHQAAEDAVQETFTRAFRALPRFDGEFRLLGWLHRILANVCIDEGSRRLRETDLVERVGSLAHAGVADPAELTVRSEARASVAAALEELPDAYRTAVALRYLDDLSYREIAAATGVTEENARARASRGRAVLQRLLGHGAAALVLVFPGWRRAHRAPVVADPATAVSSSNLADQVGQMAVAAPVATPLTNLSAQITVHIVQAAPAVTRLAEVSASMGGGRSTIVANVIGAVAAVMVPVAASAVTESHGADRPSVVEASDDSGRVAGGDVVSITSTSTSPSPLSPSGAPATANDASMPTTTTTTAAPVLAIKLPSPAGTESASIIDAGAAVRPEPAQAEAEAEAEDQPRHGLATFAALVSDELTVTVEHSGLALSGRVGFATAESAAGPGSHRSGDISWQLELEDASADGKRWISEDLTLVLDGQAHELELEGWLVEAAADDGATRYEFVGSYRIRRPADLGLSRRGPASWALLVGAPDDAGAPTTRSALRMTMGERPEPEDPSGETAPST